MAQLKNEPKALMDISPEKIYRWQIKMKICPTFYVIKEIQIKMRYYYTPVAVPQIQKTDSTKSW